MIHILYTTYKFFICLSSRGDDSLPRVYKLIFGSPGSPFICFLFCIFLKNRKTIWLWSLHRCGTPNFLCICKNFTELCPKKISFSVYFNFLLLTIILNFFKFLLFIKITISSDFDTAQRLKLQTRKTIARCKFNFNHFWIIPWKNIESYCRYIAI